MNEIEQLSLGVKNAKNALEKAEAELQARLQRAYGQQELLTFEGLPFRVWFSRGKYRLKSALSRSAREALEAKQREPVDKPKRRRQTPVKRT